MNFSQFENIMLDIKLTRSFNIKFGHLKNKQTLDEKLTLFDSQEIAIYLTDRMESFVLYY